MLTSDIRVTIEDDRRDKGEIVSTHIRKEAENEKHLGYNYSPTLCNRSS
jgi:hypothetical protein